MNPRLEPLLIATALWLAVAVVLTFTLMGCAVPLRSQEYQPSDPQPADHPSTDHAEGAHTSNPQADRPQVP